MQNQTISNIHLDNIHKLIDKAEKSREAHFLASHILGRKGKVLHSLILIGSSIVAILTFADYNSFKIIIKNLDKDSLTLFTGVLASIVFILTVIEEFVSWKEAAQAHEQAGKLLTTFIRTANSIKNDTNIGKKEVDIVTDRYTFLNEQIPVIPNKIFLRAKREHLIKVSISRQLDLSPLHPIWYIKYKLLRKK